MKLFPIKKCLILDNYFHNCASNEVLVSSVHHLNLGPSPIPKLSISTNVALISFIFLRTDLIPTETVSSLSMSIWKTIGQHTSVALFYLSNRDVPLISFMS